MGDDLRRARGDPMIELILQADRAMAVGLLDQAERLYRQAAELDPRNSMAVVGLARVVLDRGDDRAALVLAHKALAIDPENAAAQRLAARLEEILRFRGEEPPAAPEPVGPQEPEPPSPPAESEPAAPPRRRSLLDRLRRRR
jgi:thioredoxin-like negative regulator of GroEL